MIGFFKGCGGGGGGGGVAVSVHTGDHQFNNRFKVVVVVGVAVV